jgi:hypothetical protein
MLDECVQDEKPKITKDMLSLLGDYYAHPNTSTLIFRFEPQLFSPSESRLQSSCIKRASIAGKDLYLVDGFFRQAEAIEMHHFSKNATFSRNSYGSPEAIEKGEKPALSMNGKERWQFFASPPRAITEVYKLLGTLSFRLNAEITTLPWELCDREAHGSPAVIANKLEEASAESREWGKHQDCNPENKVSFGIPVLYSEEKMLHAEAFINGAPGKPWLISVMVYSSDENFLPEYCMGTVFYDQLGQIALRVNCSNMRLVLFEGDILHSIEESNIPPGIKTWRVSYVFKLIVNPKDPTVSLRQAFFDYASRVTNLENLSLGPIPK